MSAAISSVAYHLGLAPGVLSECRAREPALADFGNPHLLDPGRTDEILQLGVAPNRIDLLLETGPEFDELWRNRIEGRHGRASPSWVDLDGLLAIKKRIDHPRHRDDVRVLERVRERRKR